MDNSMTIYFRSGKKIKVTEEVGEHLIKALEKNSPWVTFKTDADKTFLSVHVTEVEFIAKDRILKA